MSKTRERQKAARAAAMPEIRKLTRKFGLSIVSGCVKRLHDQAKAAAKLAEMKREVERLERETK